MVSNIYISYTPITAEINEIAVNSRTPATHISIYIIVITLILQKNKKTCISDKLNINGQQYIHIIHTNQ